MSYVASIMTLTFADSARSLSACGTLILKRIGILVVLLSKRCCEHHTWDGFSNRLNLHLNSNSGAGSQSRVRPLLQTD